jgi:hypothetical protein
MDEDKELCCGVYAVDGISHMICVMYGTEGYQWSYFYNRTKRGERYSFEFQEWEYNAEYCSVRFLYG